ncbi:MAG: hypothetical protein AB1640_24940 [bacterium]
MDCSVFVCGHIHEAAGRDRVGLTLVLNPGVPAQGGGRAHRVRRQLDPGDPGKVLTRSQG